MLVFPKKRRFFFHLFFDLTPTPSPGRRGESDPITPTFRSGNSKKMLRALAQKNQRKIFLSLVTESINIVGLFSLNSSTLPKP